MSFISNKLESDGNFPPSVEESGSKDCGAAGITVPKSSHYLAIATFCLLGNSQLLIWNMVLSSFESFHNFVWPGHLLADLMGGFEHGAALLVAIVMLKFNGLSTKLCHITGVVNILLYLLLPLVPQLLPAEVSQIVGDDGETAFVVRGGNDPFIPAAVLLSIFSVFLGICSGLFHVQGYAMASILPRNYCAYVSTGNGIAGVLSFGIYTIMLKIFERTQSGQIHLIWAFFVSGAVLSLLQVVCFYFLSREKWFQQCIERSKKEQPADTIRTAEFGERRSVVEVFKECYLEAFNASFTLFVTLLLFPLCGPFGWHKSMDVANYLMGTFQILDLLLRWLPALGGWTKLHPKLLRTLVYLRPVILIPLFVLPMRVKNLPFFGSTPWLFILMAIFTITSGWFVTLSAIYCPECVQHPAEKEIASEVFVISLLAFITIGIFMSRILTIGM